MLILFQPAPWRDARHRSTLCWMVAGLLTSGWIALDEWTPGVVGRAVYAQSTVRRFRRWLSNPRIDALRLYATLLRATLGEFPDERLYVALDTTLLWNEVCVVQVALVWRGRTAPVAWKVPRCPSASVAFENYRGVLHVELLLWAKAEGWYSRIRGKRGVGLFMRDGRRYAPYLTAGELCFYAGVFLGAARVPVERAVDWEKGAKEPWIIVTDEAAGPTPCVTMACVSRSRRVFWTTSPVASSGKPQSCMRSRHCNGSVW